MINPSQGVVVPAGQRRELERTEPNKILDVIPATVYAIRYGDGAGRVIKEFWYEVGGVFYQPPGAEQFADQLREVKETLVKQVKAKLGTNAFMPSNLQTDVVDVVAKKTAQEVSGDSGVDV